VYFHSCHRDRRGNEYEQIIPVFFYPAMRLKIRLKIETEFNTILFRLCLKLTYPKKVTINVQYKRLKKNLSTLAIFVKLRYWDTLNFSLPKPWYPLVTYFDDKNQILFDTNKWLPKVVCNRTARIPIRILKEFCSHLLSFWQQFLKNSGENTMVSW